MELRYKINTRVLLLAFVGIIMVCSSYLMFVYQPLQLIMRKVLTLAPGSILFHLWSTPPYEVILRVYVFNVTNRDQFMRGEEKLKMEEIGPYAYQEILTNKNATFNEDGTVEFIPNRQIVFDPSRSVGDPFTDRLISPNLPLVGIQASLNDATVYTNLGFSAVTRLLGAKSFTNLTINEYLWGYEDKIVTVAHKFLPNWIDFGKFGILERMLSRDNKNKVTITVDPSIVKSSNHLLTPEEKTAMYHIVKWNGSPGLTEWGYNGDNNTVGEHDTKQQIVEGAYEGTIFPPNLPQNMSLVMFRKAFCRPVPLEFDKEGLSTDGFRAYNYRMARNIFSVPEVNPVNQVYCPKSGCPMEGLGSIAPCYYNIPIVLSRPHFLYADPSILEQFDGLSPNESVHDGLAQIHPEIGIPIGGDMKIQVNLDVGNTRFNSLTKPFNGITLPLFWLQLSAGDLPTFVYVLVNLGCHIGPVVQVIIMYLLGLVGIALISGSALIILFFSRPTVNPTISLHTEYSPLPLINIPAQYFKPEIRICK